MRHVVAIEKRKPSWPRLHVHQRSEIRQSSTSARKVQKKSQGCQVAQKTSFSNIFYCVNNYHIL